MVVFIQSTQRKLLIKIYSGKLPVSLDLVSLCLLRVGGMNLSKLVASYNTVAADSEYDHSDNCSDKDVSLPYKFWLRRNVWHSSVLPGQR